MDQLNFQRLHTLFIVVEIRSGLSVRVYPKQGLVAKKEIFHSNYPAPLMVLELAPADVAHV